MDLGSVVPARCTAHRAASMYGSSGMLRFHHTSAVVPTHIRAPTRVRHLKRRHTCGHRPCVWRCDPFLPIRTMLQLARSSGGAPTDTRDIPGLAGLLRRQAGDSPHRVAVMERGGVATTYAALWSRAAAFAAALERCGVQPGDRVGLLLERTADAIAALFGIHAIGGVATVLNSRLRARQVEYVLDHSDAAAMISSQEMLAALHRPISTRARFLDVSAVPRTARYTIPSRAPDSEAQIIYTSGSTGMPKGVTFSAGALDAGTRIVMTYLDMRAEDRVASLLPLSSVYGLNQVLCTVRAGATLLIVDSPVAADVVATLSAWDVTIMAGVPPLWTQLLDVPEFAQGPLPTLRQMQNAGGHLPTRIVGRLRAAQPQAALVLQYGQTETFRGTYLPSSELDAHPESMGRPIPEADILVVREDGSLCEPGEIGELVQFGPTIASGYWRDPDATARVFRPHPHRRDGARGVHSGDLVRRDASGLLYFVSRRDRLIKTLGYRVGPDEVVDVLMASGEIVEAVVTSEPDPVRGERIVAYIVLARNGSQSRLASYVRRELPRYMQPSRIDVRDALARLVSGKYDLDAIRAPVAPLLA